MKELAERWGCSPAIVYGLIARGSLNSLRLGARTLRITTDTIKEYETRRTIVPKTEEEQARQRVLQDTLRVTKSCRARLTRAGCVTKQPDYQIRLYRRKWALYWRDGGTSKRWSLGTTDRVEAGRLAKIAMAAELDACVPFFTVTEFWHRYQASLEGRPAHKTMGYEAKAILPYFGHLRPVDLNVPGNTNDPSRPMSEDDVVNGYIAIRRAASRSDGTILTELNRLASALNYGKKAGLLDRVPTIMRPQAPSPRERHLTKAEASALLAAADEPHLRIFISLALCTGARRAAILGLTWDRVDLTGRRIDFRDPTLTRPLKGRAIVPLNGRAVAELTTARSSHTHVINYNDKPVASVKTSLRSLCNKVGIPAITSHVFRHTAAVWMAESRVPMAEIASYLGHKDSRVTEMHYARYSPDYLARAADTLDF